MSFAISVGVAGLGLSAVSMIGASKTAGIQAAATLVGQKEQSKQNKLQMEIDNAGSSTQRAIQVINNNRILKAGGKAQDAARQNIVRNADAFAKGSLEQRLGHAEQAGSYAANVASKGVGGASADAITMSLALQQSRQKQAASQNNEYMSYDQAKQAAGIMPSALEQLDMTVFSGGVDNSVVLPAIRGGTDWAGLGATVLTSNLAKAIPDMFSSSTTNYLGNGLSGGTYGLQAPKQFFGSSTGLSGIKLK